MVNYRDEDVAEQIWAAAPDGVSRIVELALGPNLSLDLAREYARPDEPFFDE